MKRLSIVALLFFVMTARGQEKAGVIRGVVRFVGEVPPDQRIMTTDGGTVVHNDLVVDAKTKGLRFVVMHLEKTPLHKVPPRKEKVTIDQRDMLFLPRVVAIQEGQTIRFENNDLCNHGVRSNALEKANVFNVNTPPGQPFDFDFKAHKHPAVIDCPIHTWMKAYVFTFEHPFFAVTDEKGTFVIRNVPAGKHNLVFRHIDTGKTEVRPVEVRAGEEKAVNIDWKSAEKK